MNENSKATKNTKTKNNYCSSTQLSENNEDELRTATDTFNLNKGSWSDEEKRKFFEGIISWPYSWDKIQSHIKTRDVKQLRSFSQKLFNKFQLFNITEHKIKYMQINTITEEEFEEEFIKKALMVGVTPDVITKYKENKNNILNRLKKLNKSKLNIIRAGSKDYEEIYNKRKLLFKVDNEANNTSRILTTKSTLSCKDLEELTSTSQACVSESKDTDPWKNSVTINLIPNFSTLDSFNHKDLSIDPLNTTESDSYFDFFEKEFNDGNIASFDFNSDLVTNGLSMNYNPNKFFEYVSKLNEEQKQGNNSLFPQAIPNFLDEFDSMIFNSIHRSNSDIKM